MRIFNVKSKRRGLTVIAKVRKGLGVLADITNQTLYPSGYPSDLLWESWGQDNIHPLQEGGVSAEDTFDELG